MRKLEDHFRLLWTQHLECLRAGPTILCFTTSRRSARAWCWCAPTSACTAEVARDRHDGGARPSGAGTGA